MGVIYIGDRAAGKTHLALELANPNNKYVRVSDPDYQTLKARLLDEDGTVRGTSAAQALYEQYLEVNVTLPTGVKTITLDWLDTPGEIWRPKWQTDYPSEWKRFLETIRRAEGILLIVPPYRNLIEMIVPAKADLDEFITKQQWCNRFTRWIDFFRQDCPKIRHLVLCLNKADLFCPNLQQEVAKLAYNPDSQFQTWQQKDSYVYQRYFRPIHAQIDQLNNSISGLSVRCFITSVYDRSLLELPWIYLGSHLAN